MARPTQPLKFSAYIWWLVPYLTMTDPELNAGNPEVDKIVLVLGIRKSRQNGVGT